MWFHSSRKFRLITGNIFFFLQSGLWLSTFGCVIKELQGYLFAGDTNEDITVSKFLYRKEVIVTCKNSTYDECRLCCLPPCVSYQSLSVPVGAPRYLLYITAARRKGVKREWTCCVWLGLAWRGGETGGRLLLSHEDWRGSVSSCFLSFF